jgi:rhodanese-related sulfurtransferase
MSQATTSLKNPTIASSMKDLLEIYPGARRTLFQRYHLGGCSSCSFSLEETLEELCKHNGELNPNHVLKELEEAHIADEQLLITPEQLRDHLYNSTNDHLRLVDIRTREEFEAVHIPTSELLTQELMQESMNHWPKENLLILIDHRGERSLDAAAYFSGHGFTNVKSLRGGIDAYAANVDRSLPQYTVESCSTETEAQD